MFTIKSKNRFSDTLRIKCGEKTLILKVDMDVAYMTPRVRKAQWMIAKAQEEAQKAGTPESVEMYGKAIQALIEAVFGEEQAERLLDFYEGHPDSLLDDIIPYIMKRVTPKLKKLNARRAGQLRKAKR